MTEKISEYNTLLSDLLKDNEPLSFDAPLSMLDGEENSVQWSQMRCLMQCFMTLKDDDKNLLVEIASIMYENQRGKK